MIELAVASYEEWVHKVFDHAGAPPDGEPWYSNEAGRVTASQPMTLLHHFTKFCLEIRAFTPRFSRDQVDQGLRLLLSGGYGALGQHLPNPELDLVGRKDCIRAMAVPFSDYIAGLEPPLEDSFYMWWHFVLRSAGWDRPGTAGDSADVELRGEAFGSLKRILSIENLACQACALHGLGHLNHDERRAFVSEWIDGHQSTIVSGGLDQDWLAQCRDGSVM